MSIELMERFFLWCMIVNTAVYTVTALAVMSMPDFLFKMQSKFFDLDETEAKKATQTYLANFKLLITIFNFTPWIAFLIIK